MKQKWMICALTGLAVLGMMMTGCAQEETESSSEAATEPATTVASTEVETEAATTTVASTEAPEETLKTIGEKAEGENAYGVQLKNMTGQEITGVSVKDSSMEEFPDNFLEESDVFAKEEERILYYDATDAIAASESSGSDSDPILTPEYTIQLTFSDGTTAELHQFPFEDLEIGEIYYEDEVAYLVYTSVSSNTEVNTKEAEMMQQETATEAGEESDTEDSSAQEEESESVEESVVYEETPVYEEEESSEESVYEAPVEDSYEAPVQQEESSDASVDNGCIGDEGLFN